ncbi:MAG: CPBP family intramembrane metalloprotease [Anaerolineales bacterium]|nr:CPBP family intramembrane metalloprotease [Anaerolineales bacterium]
MSHKLSFSEIVKRFAFGLPVLFSILAIILAGVLTEIPIDKVLKAAVSDPGPEFLKVLIGHTLTGFLLVWVIVKLGLFKDARFTSPTRWKAVWLVWPLVVLTLLNLSSLFDGSLTIDTTRPWIIVLYVAMNLAIGFCEEVMGRGLVLNVMLRKWGSTRKGIYQAVLMSGVLFGAAHIFNLISGHLPLISNLTQIGYSISFGVVFAACFLRNNSIWPVLIMHAAIDIGGGLRHLAVNENVQAAAPNNTLIGAAMNLLIIALPLLLYGLFILRKVTLSEEHNRESFSTTI